MTAPSERILRVIAEAARTMSRAALEERYTAYAQAELRAEFAAATAKQEAAAVAESESVERGKAEREAARAEDRERTRKTLWLRHFNDAAVAAHPEGGAPSWADVVAHAAKNTPATGWPPGVDPDEFGLGPTDVELASTDFESTTLGRLAKEMKFI